MFLRKVEMSEPTENVVDVATPPADILDVPDDTMSRVHRFMINDRVQYIDNNQWPPVTMEGVVKGFTNDENTYLAVTFDDGSTKVLTEDELHRLG
jgi:hypothetical protein